MQQQFRINYLDALRGFLMSLGVLLHSARIYDTKQSWRVADGSSSEFFNYLVAIIHSFRMPAFFIIAGYFCWMAAKKLNLKAFGQKRLQRLLIPLIFVALTLNVLQFNFINTAINEQIPSFNMLHYLLYGEWVSHLWFLINLIVYHLIVMILMAKAPALHKQLSTLMESKMFIGFLCLGLLAYPVVLSGFFSVFPFLNFSVLNTVTLESLLYYLPYFIVGVCIFSRIDVLSWFDSHIKAYAMFSAIIALMLYSLPYLALPTPIQTVADKILIFIGPFFYFGLLCSIAKRFFNGESRLIRAFSDASYTIYLVHHLLIIVLGYYLSLVELSIFLKFGLLVSAVTIFSYCLHAYIVNRSSLLKWLFNGKAFPAKKGCSYTSAVAAS